MSQIQVLLEHPIPTKIVLTSLLGGLSVRFYRIEPENSYTVQTLYRHEIIDYATCPELSNLFNEDGWNKREVAMLLYGIADVDLVEA